MDTKNKDSKPEVITTIDVNIQWPKIEKRAWIEESLDEHFHCILCGESLQFKHKTDFALGAVTEDAHCPSCGVRNRQTNHRLQ